MTPPRSPVGGHAPRVFEGVLARSDEQYENPYWILEDGREVSTDDDWFGQFPAVDMRGKRVRLTVEVLPEPPADGRASSEGGQR